MVSYIMYSSYVDNQIRTIMFLCICTCTVCPDDNILIGLREFNLIDCIYMYRHFVQYVLIIVFVFLYMYVLIIT